MKRALIALAFASPLLAASAAQAQSVSLVAHLLGSAEVPATQSDAFAEAPAAVGASHHVVDVAAEGVDEARGVVLIEPGEIALHPGMFPIGGEADHRACP